MSYGVFVTAKLSGKSIEELLAEKEDGTDGDNKTNTSSVVQTPVEQGITENHETITSAREERDLERGPD